MDLENEPQPERRADHHARVRRPCSARRRLCRRRA
jgi:hypothetical protein